MITHLKIHSEVRTTPGDEDGSVLINLESGRVFSLNGVGAKIWTKLQERLTFEAILDSLTQEYDISHEQLRTDLEAFIYDLEKKGLLEPVVETVSYSVGKGANHGVRA